MDKTEPTSRLIGVTTAAALIGVDRSTLVRWVSAGKVPVLTQLDGKTGAYVFDRAAIESMRQERAS